MNFFFEVWYAGERTAEGCKVEVWRDGDTSPLSPRNEIRNHSPDGFNWGYGGSGPAQLALALCCEVLPPHFAELVYQDFKRAFVARIDADRWRLSEGQLANVVWDLALQELIRRGVDPAGDCFPPLLNTEGGDAL